eukprot:gene5595-9410_t
MLCERTVDRKIAHYSTRYRGKKEVDYWYLSDHELASDYEEDYVFFESIFRINTESIHGKPFRSALHHIMHRDNPHLIEGYRKMPAGSYWDCLLSIFTLHNETINIWSHLLPGLLWVYSLFFVIPKLLVNGTFMEKLIAGYLYPIGAIMVFTGSTLFHIFKCNSIRDYHFFLVLDLSGILVLFTAGFPLKNLFNVLNLGNAMGPWIELTCYPTYQIFFTIFGLIFGIILIWPVTPILVKYRLTNLRTFLYFTLLLYSFILYYIKVLIIEAGMYDSFKWKSQWMMLRMYIIGGSALIIRTLKYPERLIPKKFNIFFSSHQLFHILAAWGIWITYFDMIELYQSGHYTYCQTD